MSMPPEFYVATLRAMTKQYKAIAQLQRIAMQNGTEEDRAALMSDLDAMTETLEAAIAAMERHANEQQRG
jgi:ribosome recycling factor